MEFAVRRTFTSGPIEAKANRFAPIVRSGCRPIGLVLDVCAVANSACRRFRCHFRTEVVLLSPAPALRSSAKPLSLKTERLNYDTAERIPISPACQAGDVLSSHRKTQDSRHRFAKEM